MTPQSRDTPVFLWDLPDVLVFKIVTYSAAPSNRATVLCHSIAPLCKAMYKKILPSTETSSIWDMLLIEDYGSSTSKPIRERRGRHIDRRECKRLRRSTIHRVRDAHRLICDNTEIAYFYLSEMVNCIGSSKLSKARLISLLREYGPNLRMNRPVSSGGLFLVEICRAKNVKEVSIVRCVQELVERWGVQIDLRTAESDISCQTALCVAAARGFTQVVRYLISHGASKDIVCSGRFALHTRPKKIIRCINQTAFDFAETMLNAEISEGANESVLGDLTMCTRFLLPAGSANELKNKNSRPNRIFIDRL
jgi:hypothetical protein